MMKKIDVRLLLLTSVGVLLPMLVGICLWQVLPETLPTHFGLDGTANGFSSKEEAVVLLPLVMLGLHVFAVMATSLDPKAKNVSRKMRKIVYWLVPSLNALVQLSIYGVALGLLHDVTRLGLIFISILFIILGNYLPKTKQNYTVGIRLPWTLHDEDNWNKTHRLAGKLWVLGGLIVCGNAYFSWGVSYVLVFVFLIMALVPAIYSYWLSRSQDQR